MKQHNRNDFDVTVIADSKNQFGDRVTSLLVTLPRIVLAELNTHRMFSRNSASSRAIPFNKMVKTIEEHPFVPIAWQKNHKGMQGTEYLSLVEDIYPPGDWLEGRDKMIETAKKLHADGVTKQLCNRLLEPFMWQTVLITASEWENFFNLRCPQYNINGTKFRSKKDAIKQYPNDIKYDSVLDWLQINESQAEIHIQKAAEMIWDRMNESEPKKLEAEQWHVPFCDNINDDIILQKLAKEEEIKHLDSTFDIYQFYAIKIATARSARTSYLNFEGKDDYSKDIELHDNLLKYMHLSPFEHCCVVPTEKDYNLALKGKEKGWFDNFHGFISYRYMLRSN